MGSNSIRELTEEINEFIFEQDRYFDECHAATVLQLPNGNFLAAWFAGTREGAPDVAIWLATRDKNLQRWSEPRIVADVDNLPHWNPVLFYDNGTVYLFYRTGYTIPNWQSWVIESNDGGQTFSNPEPLPDGFLGPIKNKPILMSDGNWLCPSSRESANEWFCVMEIFSPRHNLWTKSEPIKVKTLPKGIIQPTVWESIPGNIHALMRSTDGWIYRADSSDYGRTFSEPYRTDLPNPNSGIDCVRLADGRVVLVYNPVSLTPISGLNSRSPPTISTS